MNATSSRPLAAYGLSAGVFLLGSLACLVMVATDGTPMLIPAITTFGFLVCPLSALVLGVGAWMSPVSARPRLLVVGAVLLVIGAIATGVGMWPESGYGTAVLGSACLFGPFVTIFAVLATTQRKAARLAAERSRSASAEERVLGMVKARGEVSLDELARETSVPLDRLDDLVDALIARGALDAVHDAGARTVSTRSYAAALSATAKKLAADPRCPSCGAQRAVARPGLLRCPHCRAETHV